MLGQLEAYLLTSAARVTGVYFKSLYSPSPEVKEVAHEGLRMVLTRQSRLPKELLQTGLRPILMNLADATRLSVPGLEGLARLLELLTNYFKVEIGHKLLDHFRVVADPQMLLASSRLPLWENEGITKLVHLANIFHLLPSAANCFMEDLVNVIVQTEAQMHFSGPSPLSPPLAKYLDRYPVEALDFFMRHLHFPRHLRTFRSILQAKLAPSVLRELASRTSLIVTHCIRGNDTNLLLPALSLFSDLVDLIPTWLAENGYVLDALIRLWRSEPIQPEQTAVSIPEVVQRQSSILSLFMKAVEQSPRIDLLFDIVLIYTRGVAMDLVPLTHFLYRHIALSDDLLYRRNILMRFLTWFDDDSYSWPHKGFFIRLVVSPLLLVHASRSSDKEGLLDIDFVRRVHRRIWQPLIDSTTFAEVDDIFKIDLLHLTTIIVQHYPEVAADMKKDIIRCAWVYISSEDAIVKQTSYLLAARFFESYDTPQKFLLRAWTGLLRPPHPEGRALVRQALEILAPVLPRSSSNEPGYPQWAKTTRRLLAEEGISQIIIIYQLIVRQPELFFPVRALFIPHMVNSLSKLGLSSASTIETRLLSIDVLQVMFDWEQRVSSDPGPKPIESNAAGSLWATPVSFRETMVSYLVRLATVPLDAALRAVLVPRALTLLQLMTGPSGWTDVTVKLHFFSRALEQVNLCSICVSHYSPSSGIEQT
jgi:transformation/transcription domain-associated protein